MCLLYLVLLVGTLDTFEYICFLLLKKKQLPTDPHGVEEREKEGLAWDMDKHFNIYRDEKYI